MKCPKCGYTSFDYLESCAKCGQSLAEKRKQLNLLFSKPTLFTLATTLGDADDPVVDERANNETAAGKETATPEETMPTVIAPEEAGKVATPPAKSLGSMDLLAEQDDLEEIKFETLTELQSIKLDDGGTAPAEEEFSPANESAETANQKNHNDFLELDIDLNEEIGNEDSFNEETDDQENIIELQDEQIFDLELELDEEATNLDEALQGEKA